MRESQCSSVRVKCVLACLPRNSAVLSPRIFAACVSSAMSSGPAVSGSASGNKMASGRAAAAPVRGPGSRSPEVSISPSPNTSSSEDERHKESDQRLQEARRIARIQEGKGSRAESPQRGRALAKAPPPKESRRTQSQAKKGVSKKGALRT